MDFKKILGILNNAIKLVQKVSKVNGVQVKMDALEMKMELVSGRKADISFELEQEERRPEKRRKKEVDLWIQSVGSLEGQVHELGRKVEEGNFLTRLMLENQVSGLATEVENLHKKGRFANGLTLDVKPARGYELQPGELVGQASQTKRPEANGLTLDVKPARGYELQPGELVGQASQTKRDEIWDCLMKEEVLHVGVWGQGGVGKTFLVKHIHDQIVQDCPRFDGACMVTVSQEGTVSTIQADIANYLKLDMTEVSGVYGGARLKRALQGRKILLILDDVSKFYSLEEVGIPLERNGCKLIMTSRSRDVCEQMNCHELVHVETLPGEIP